MTVLRVTRALKPYLPAIPAPGFVPPPRPVLGDWYAMPVEVDGEDLLLLCSSTTLLPLVTFEGYLAELPNELPELVRRRLQRLGVPARQINRELNAMGRVSVAPTSSRPILGAMTSLALELPYHLLEGWDETSLPWAELALQRLQVFAWSKRHRTIVSADEARRVLEAAWGR